jgi:hypothetical protein
MKREFREVSREGKAYFAQRENWADILGIIFFWVSGEIFQIVHFVQLEVN